MRNFFVRAGLAAGAVCASMFYATQASALQAERTVLTPAELGKEIVVVYNDDEKSDESAESHKEQIDAPKYWLGIALKAVEGDLATYLGSTDGVLVDSVYPESPAEKAGLLKGDILIQVGDDKLSEPTDLLAQMKAVKADESGKVAPLKLVVQRKSEKINIDLVPTERPKETMVTVEATAGKAGEHGDESEVLMLDLHGKTPEEIEKMVKGGLRVFRIGEPAGWVLGSGNGQTQVKMLQNEDGKRTEISVERQGEEPAKITVKRDGETKVYTSDEMDEMPENIRKMVKEMLAKKGRVVIESRIESSTDGAEKGKKESEKDQAAKKSEAKSRIAIMRSEGLDQKIAEMMKGAEMNKELAEKYREMAEQIANRARESADWARDAASMPAEIKALQSEVEALRAELKELRQQLKSKETVEK